MAGVGPSLDEIYLCAGDCEALDRRVQEHRQVVESLKHWQKMMMEGWMTVECYEYLYRSANRAYGFLGVWFD